MGSELVESVMEEVVVVYVGRGAWPKSFKGRDMKRTTRKMKLSK